MQLAFATLPLQQPWDFSQGMSRRYQNMDNHPLIGKILADDYQIVSFLGKGGMGMVFVGQQLSLNRKVAVKLLPTLDLSFEEAYRFEAEIAAMATLCHPHIVTIHHRGKYGDPPTLFYVMEFLEGGSLKDYLKEYGKLPISTSLRLIHQVAEGLSYAHEQGCIHRDIKPDNLLFNRNYRILKIADFGIAKQMSGPTITHSQNIVGTFLYAAPEQMRWFESGENDAPIDARADQYSLGIVLYEMMSGRVPYPARNLLEMMKSLTEPPIPFASAIGHAVPQSVEWLIQTMISKDREKRFANDETLLEAIAGVEMEQAASSSTRVFAIKTEETIQVPPPLKTAVAPPMPLQSERLLVQNLKTVECSPTEIIRAARLKKIALAVGIFLVLLLFVLIIWPTHTITQPDTVTVKIEAEYEPNPPKDYPPIQVFVRNQKTNASLQLPASLEPGSYQLSVMMAGYVCAKNGSEIQFQPSHDPHILKLKLTAVPRKISRQILNQSNSRTVTPLLFLINRKEVNSDHVFAPGPYHLYAQFQDYYALDTPIIIPPGNDAFCYATVLRPLKQINFSFQPWNYPNAGKLDLQAWIDGQELIPAHYQSQHKDDWIYVGIRIPEEGKSLMLRWGFYYEELPTNQPIVPLRSLAKIDTSRLLKYLDQNQKLPEFQQILDFLWKNEQTRLKSIPALEQKKIYEWLVNKTQPEDLRDIQTSLWLLRELLDNTEAQQRELILKNIKIAENMTSEERIIFWKKLQEKISQDHYSQYLHKLEEYDQGLWDYEKTFREAVNECIISPSEKRRLQNLARKLKSEDVQKVYQRIEIYLKELKCKRSLQEMLQD